MVSNVYFKKIEHTQYILHHQVNLDMKHNNDSLTMKYFVPYPPVIVLIKFIPLLFSANYK